MSRSLAICAMLVAFAAAGIWELAAAPGVAAAAKAKAKAKTGKSATSSKSKSSKSKKKSKSRSKRSKRARASARASRPLKLPSMPAGWQWPPSDAMVEDGKACLAELDALGVKWTAAPAVYAINTPVVVEDMTFGGLVVKRTRSKGPIVMDCALARGLARDAAPVLRRLDVVELHVGQLHAEREVAGVPGGLSRHSLGLAVDVYGFVTADGVLHPVEPGYVNGDPLLHMVEIELGRTGAFRTLMTPGNDPGPHHDHFHVEARAFKDRIVPRLVRGSRHDFCGVLDTLAMCRVLPATAAWATGLCAVPAEPPRAAAEPPRRAAAR